MQERINLAQWDNDNDPQMIKKIKDINNMWFICILVSSRCIIYEVYIIYYIYVLFI
jgi:hypothetical protein